MVKNEELALKGQYERRCKLLGDAAMHWKGQTTTLYNKFTESLAMLKQEQERYKTETDEEMRRLRADYNRELDSANRKHIDVCWNSIWYVIESRGAEGREQEAGGQERAAQRQDRQTPCHRPQQD